MNTHPQIPDVPILTPDRLAIALAHFLSEERSIEESAAIEKQSVSNLRSDIKNDPLHAASVYPVGYKNDGTALVKTTMRLRWLAQDRAAAAYSQALEANSAKRQRRK